MANVPFIITEKSVGVFMTYLDRNKIDLSPDYQRPGEIWKIGKQQLLVDSVINGFDIPKIYMCKLKNAGDRGCYDFGVIDGKQRLAALWGFINNVFPLDPEFVFIRNAKVKLGGLYYRDLEKKHPDVKGIFDSTSLNIVYIETENMDYVEEIFARLNSGTTLSAPEFRNSLGGPLVKAVRHIAKKSFFTKIVPIANRRYQHLDMAAKFLYIEYKNGAANTSKYFLDDFVQEFKKRKLEEKAEELERKVEKNLERFDSVFADRDPLLDSTSIVITLYLLLRDGVQIHRGFLEKFIAFVEKNKKSNEPKPELMEFVRLSQSPNSAAAMLYRCKVLRDYFEAGDIKPSGMIKNGK